MKLKDKVAVVTGASSGIGRALCVELGLHGAIVIAAARSAENLQQTAFLLSGYGIEHSAVTFDVTSSESINTLVQTISKRYHSVDIVVNNAGIGLFERLLQSTAEDRNKVFETNCWGPLNLVKSLLPLMKGSLVVNVSSAAAKYAPYRQGMYSASKAALDRMTEALSLEENSFRTLLVVPDRTDTPFMGNCIGPRENATLALALKATSTELVVKRIVQAIIHEKDICYTTSKSRVYSMLSILTPGLIKTITKKAIR